VLYGKYRFSSVLLDDALLPPFKGSTFRGVFGLALKFSFVSVGPFVLSQTKNHNILEVYQMF